MRAWGVDEVADLAGKEKEGGVLVGILGAGFGGVGVG